MRKVPLDMLTPDMKLARTIVQGNSVLIRAGSKNLNRYNKQLRKLGITSLYIEDTVSEDIDIEDIVSDKTRIKCKASLETVMNRVQTEFTVDSGLVKDMVGSLLEEILNHPKTLFSLSALDNTDESTLNHSVNTTIYAVCLGMELQYGTRELMELAEGALLHDLGKVLIDKKVLLKPAKLTKEEFEEVKQHSSKGYDMLKKMPNMSERSRQISLYHHERIDGSGYPFGMKGDEIPQFAKLVAIVDVYEALTSERCYHKAMSPYQALEILSEEAVTKMDMELTAKFMQNVAAYPNGTMVHLSDGNIGVVKKQNPSMPLRPVVRVLGNENGKPVIKYEVDLMKVLNITINEPQGEIWLPT